VFPPFTPNPHRRDILLNKFRQIGCRRSIKTDLATAINDAAKGRQLITVIPFDQQGKYLAVYK
jgi:hypothetical protein